MGTLFSNGVHRLSPTSTPLLEEQFFVSKQSLFSILPQIMLYLRIYIFSQGKLQLVFHARKQRCDQMLIINKLLQKLLQNFEYGILKNRVLSFVLHNKQTLYRLEQIYPLFFHFYTDSLKKLGIAEGLSEIKIFLSTFTKKKKCILTVRKLQFPFNQKFQSHC